MSVQGEIFEWVQGFEPWKQELFIRAASAPELSSKDAEMIAAMLLAEDGANTARPREIRREDLFHGDGVDEPMVIEKITELQGVNAIVDGQTMPFDAKGVNVIWAPTALARPDTRAC